MSQVFFISDLHIGHSAILRYSPERKGSNIDEHDLWLVEQWNSVVKKKRDIVYILGDVCFDKKKLWVLDKMAGTKYLLLGNHDLLPFHLYQCYFDKIIGFRKYHEFWISHAPIHESELRGRCNIHGHTHSKNIRHSCNTLDKRYINVSVEQLKGVPISLDDIREKIRGEGLYSH